MVKKETSLIKIVQDIAKRQQCENVFTEKTKQLDACRSNYQTIQVMFLEFNTLAEQKKSELKEKLKQRHVIVDLLIPKHSQKHWKIIRTISILTGRTQLTELNIKEAMKVARNQAKAVSAKIATASEEKLKEYHKEYKQLHVILDLLESHYSSMTPSS